MLADVQGQPCPLRTPTKCDSDGNGARAEYVLLKGGDWEVLIGFVGGSERPNA